MLSFYLFEIVLRLVIVHLLVSDLLLLLLLHLEVLRADAFASFNAKLIVKY